MPVELGGEEKKKTRKEKVGGWWGSGCLPTHILTYKHKDATYSTTRVFENISSVIFRAWIPFLASISFFFFEYLSLCCQLSFTEPPTHKHTHDQSLSGDPHRGT